MFTGDEAWLETVCRSGWTSERQRRFLDEYGGLLRRTLVAELGKRFGASALRGLSAYLTALERGDSAADTTLAGPLLELAQDTWQTICLEIFKAEGNTVEKYADYCATTRDEGRTPMPFIGYLVGLVRMKVRQEIPRHRQVFHPEVQPSSPHEEGTLDAWEDRVEDPDERVRREVALADEGDRYWEGILKCDEPDPAEVEDALALPERKDHLLCWACSSLKRKTSGGRRENLIAFAAFFVSQQGPERSDETYPSPHELSLRTVRGRYWRWREGICNEIFHKSIRKDRILEQIQHELEASPYRAHLEGQSEGGS